MSENQTPGAPVTDELARNAARNQLADLVHGDDSGPEWRHEAETYAEVIVGGHTVTWEREINRAGVAVRRYVLRGEWMVDPEPSVHTNVSNVTQLPQRPNAAPALVSATEWDARWCLLQHSDEVVFADRHDDGRRWRVLGLKGTGQLVSIEAPGLGEHAEHQWADRSELVLVRRFLRPGEALTTEFMISGVAYVMPDGGEATP